MKKKSLQHYFPSVDQRHLSVISSSSRNAGDIKAIHVTGKYQLCNESDFKRIKDVTGRSTRRISNTFRSTLVQHNQPRMTFNIKCNLTIHEGFVIVDAPWKKK